MESEYVFLHCVLCKNLNTSNGVISPENPGHLFFLINQEMGQFWAYIPTKNPWAEAEDPSGCPLHQPFSQNKTHAPLFARTFSLPALLINMICPTPVAFEPKTLDILSHLHMSSGSKVVYLEICGKLRRKGLSSPLFKTEAIYQNCHSQVDTPCSL